MVLKRGFIGALLASCAVGAGFALVPAPAAAAVVTEQSSVFATDDAYTSSTRRTVNFGAADKLVVGRASGETRQSYLKFTVDSLPAGAALADAELRLPVESTAPTSTLSLLRVLSNRWSEKTLTAANAPAAGITAGKVTAGATTTVVKFDLSKVVTRPGTYSFLLKSSATTAVTRLRSLEYGDATSGGRPPPRRSPGCGRWSTATRRAAGRSCG